MKTGVAKMFDSAKQLVWRGASEVVRKRFNRSILEDIDARSSQLDQESDAKQADPVRSGTSQDSAEEGLAGDY